MQKIVFNGHYLMYFDTAVAGYWRAMAMPYHETMAYLDGDLYVRKATLEYLASARYDDTLEVGIRCSRIGNSSILFAAAVFRGDALLVSGELVYVFADPKTQTSLPVPAQLRALAAGLRSRQADARCAPGHLGSTGARGAGHPHRGVRAGAADSGRDGMGRRRCLLRARGGLQPLRHGAGHRPAARTCARRGQIGRMAVLQTMRGAGVGRALLDALVDCARQRGEQRGAAARADQRGRLLHPRRLQRRAATPSTRPASRTWRWCARCSARQLLRASNTSTWRAPRSQGCNTAWPECSMCWRSAASMPSCGPADSIA